MAIQQVTATINGKKQTLQYNQSTGRYELTAATPDGSSFPLAGGYYPVKLDILADTGENKAADDHTKGIGESLRLFVKETGKPEAEFIAPADKATVTETRPAVIARLRDGDSGIDLDSLVFTVDGKTISPGSPGFEVKEIAGGYDVICVPANRLVQGSHSASLSVSDNDGNSAVQQTRTFTVDSSTLNPDTGQICAKPLESWQVELLGWYEGELLDQGFTAELIRRCSCV